MDQVSINRSIKRAVLESLRENREVVRDLLAEVLEDVALMNAIREGEKSKPVKRSVVLKALSRRK
ncbi:MAG TPA: hypothetical protein VKK61_07555 [Tepidisphaeraceae bacterium]|nr:hypothetical protein [Tepidisphaeraceae bacterium]